MLPCLFGLFWPFWTKWWKERRTFSSTRPVGFAAGKNVLCVHISASNCSGDVSCLTSSFCVTMCLLTKAQNIRLYVAICLQTISWELYSGAYNVSEACDQRSMERGSPCRLTPQSAFCWPQSEGQTMPLSSLGYASGWQYFVLTGYECTALISDWSPLISLDD